MKRFFAVIVCIAVSFSAYAQENPNFNVELVPNFTSAEKVLDLSEGRFISTDEIANLKGNTIAGATAQYIAQRGGANSVLQLSLDTLKSMARLQDDIFHLNDAREHAAEIREFISEIQKNNFSGRVTATVEQIFPQNAKVTASVPVYFVVLGHENVDAYVRRIIWHGKEPQFVGEHEGQLTIVVNLTKAIGYQGNVHEKFIQLLGVVAHEVFHAAFGAYKDESPAWQRFYASHKRPFDALIDLTQNEGIAYYLSIDQAGRGYIPREWYSRLRDVFGVFNDNASELLSDSLSSRRAGELIRAANLSGGDFKSYGAMTGMMMARNIDLILGRTALKETIAYGPDDFFKKYI